MSGPIDKQAEAQRLQRLLGYLERDPANTQLVADAAEAALRADEADRARELIDRGLTLAGNDAGRRFHFGNLMLASGQPARALELFTALVAEVGHRPAIDFNIACAQFAQERYTDSVATLEAIPEPQRAELPRYELQLAKGLYHVARIEEALAHTERQLQLIPNDRESLGLKALVNFDLGKLPEAEATARQLLALFPDDVLGHLTLGSMAMELRQPAIAKVHMERVLARQPQMGRAWSVLAFADLQQNQLEEGTRHFDKAVQYMPNHLGTWHGLAWAQLLLGHYDAAQAAVDNAMQVDRNFAENHGTLAVLQILRGELGEAETSIKRGLRLDPKSASSHYARSLLLAERNQPEASKKLIERLLTEAGMPDAAKIADLAVGFRPGQRPVTADASATANPATVAGNKKPH